MAEVCQQVGSKNFNLAARLFKELLHGIGTVPALSWIRPGAHHHSSDTADYQGAGAHGTWLEGSIEGAASHVRVAWSGSGHSATGSTVIWR